MYTEQRRIAGKVLRRLCGVKRRFGTKEEGEVIPYLMRTILLGTFPTWVDGAGNLHIDARGPKGSRTLFVGHTDTVHRKEGRNAFLETPKGLYAKGAPLGADDAAGVSILAAMIGTVPGYYIFTRGEECGGIGARYLAENYSDLLREFDRAIAFDRRGTADVITWQAGVECCSEIFAEALSDALNTRGMLYMPSDSGVYTDTAEFVDYIPECTNISVGYYNAHSRNEWLDTAHHTSLLEAALTIPWDSLPTSRDIYGGFGTEFPPVKTKADAVTQAAIEAAIAGKPAALTQILAEHIFPEDPALARRHIDPRALSPDCILDTLSQYQDWHMVIEYLSEECFIQY